ncbi:MAG: hypothetical protein KF782_13795 [Labilithrix sp.]|nr:hypothetical protein [Labilithrix sp.]
MSTTQQHEQHDDVENDAQEPDLPDGGGQSADDIPAGMYDAQGIEGSEQIGTADTGTDQVIVDLELVDLKRQVSTILPFTEAAMPYSLKRLRALGWEGGDSFAGIGKNLVKVVVKYETYNGKRRMKVDIFTGQGRIVMKNTMNDAERRGFFARLNEFAKREGSGEVNRAAATGARGYPKDWDKGGPPAARPPRVNLG